VSNVLPSNEMLKLLWDTGATLTVTPQEEDFLTAITVSEKSQLLRGLEKGLNINGMGVAESTIRMKDGAYESSRTPAYLVRESARRYFSPKGYFQSYGKGGHSGKDGNGTTLHSINSKAL
jgi:hypothetical protein